MTLRNLIKSDAASVFLQTDEFAELLTYRFAGGGTRSVKAIVDREPPEVYDAAGNVVQPKYMINLHNNCTTGVKASEVDTGGDRVELFKDFGDPTTQTCSVLVLMAQDMGMITLALI